MTDKIAVLVAPPMGGKDTLADMMANASGSSFAHLSVSRELGKLNTGWPECDIMERMARGEINDELAEVAVRMMMFTVGSLRYSHVVLNGVGRSEIQMYNHLKYIKRFGKQVSLIFLDVSDTECRERLRYRAKQEGQRLDNGVDHLHRLAAFREIEPRLIKAARHVSKKIDGVFVHRIDANQDPRNVLHQAMKCISTPHAFCVAD